MSDELRICIVDDHLVIRDGLKRVLSDEGFRIVNEAGSAVELDKKIQHEMNWNFLILDISLPDRSGLKVLREVTTRFSKMPVLLFTMHSEQFIVHEAIQAGASGYVTKRCATSEVVKAIRQIQLSQKYFSPDLVETSVNILNDFNAPLSSKKLSKREYEVLVRLVQGKSNATIGKDLSIHAKTVSSFRARLLEKLNLSSNADLVRYALEHRLVPFAQRPS